MMIVRTLALTTGLAGAIAASQLPEYAQQYRQRLGGAIDEIARIINEFDADAARLGMSREQGIDRLARNPDAFVVDRAGRLREDSARLARLERQLASMQQAGPFARVAVMARDADAAIAKRAWESFEPAVPVTMEGATLGAAGFVGGFGLMRLILWPVGRRRKQQAQGARR